MIRADYILTIQGSILLLCTPAIREQSFLKIGKYPTTVRPSDHQFRSIIAEPHVPYLTDSQPVTVHFRPGKTRSILGGHTHTSEV